MRKSLFALSALAVAAASLLTLAPAFADPAAPLELVPAALLPTEAPQLAPLPAGADDLLFAGETQKHTVLLVAQAEQTAGPMSLLLNIQTAISSAPEASRLNVVVNDQDLGTVSLKSGAPYALRLQLPPGLVQPGFNAVTFTVDQAHRVDCSVEATYELWTRIDPKTSGIEYTSTATAVPDFVALLGAVRMSDGATAIHGLLPKDAFAADRNQLIEAIQALSIAAVIDRPKVDFGQTAGVGPGIDIAIGTRTEVADTLAATGINPDLHTGINFTQRPDGRMVLAVVGEQAGDVAQQVASLTDYSQQTAIGAPAGLVAVQRLRGVVLQPHQKISFTTLGFDDRMFAGRLLQQSVQFRMPSDFYPADYARAGIHLDALYALGLTTGAELQFKLNGKTVSTVVLSGGRTGDIHDQILPIALTAFRPGLNELKIEARLPTEADATCAPGTTTQAGGRLRVAGTSYLELPELARIGRFPDLGAIDQSIIGRSDKATLDVVADTSTPAAINAAATFLARLAYSSNRVTPTRLVSSPTGDAATPTLMVAGFRALPAELARRFPLDLSSQPFASSPTTSMLGVTIAEPAAPADAPWTDAIQNEVAQLPDAIGGQAQHVIHDVGAALYGLGKSAGFTFDALRPDDSTTSFVPSAGTNLLVAQFINEAGTAPITIITAPTMEELVPGVDEIVSDAGWTNLNGSTVTLSKLGNVLQTVPPAGVQLYSAKGITLANGRLIAAGWLSNNPAIYVVLLLVFGALLGITTALALLRTRARSR